MSAATVPVCTTRWVAGGVVVEAGAGERAHVERADETIVDDVTGHRERLNAFTIVAIA